MLSAEYEVMRDDIEAYVERLRDAGLPVEAKRYAGMVHPFLSMAGTVQVGRDALDDAAKAMRKALKTWLLHFGA